MNYRENYRELKKEWNKTRFPNRQRGRKEFVNVSRSDELLAAGFRPYMRRSELSDVIGVPVKRICKLIRQGFLPIVYFKFWAEQGATYIDLQTMLEGNDKAVDQLLELGYNTVTEGTRSGILRTEIGVVSHKFKHKKRRVYGEKKKFNARKIEELLTERTNAKKSIHWEQDIKRNYS